MNILNDCRIGSLRNNGPCQTIRAILNLTFSNRQISNGRIARIAKQAISVIRIFRAKQTINFVSIAVKSTFERMLPSSYWRPLVTQRSPRDIIQINVRRQDNRLVLKSLATFIDQELKSGKLCWRRNLVYLLVRIREGICIPLIPIPYIGRKCGASQGSKRHHYRSD